MSKAKIIAESIVNNFLIEKYNYIGEIIHRGKIEMINRSLSESRITFLVFMYVSKNSKFENLRKEIEIEALAYTDQLISQMKELTWSV